MGDLEKQPHLDATVVVENKDRPSSMSVWHWIAVVGVGTVLLPFMFQFMSRLVATNNEFIQTKLIESLDKSTSASTASQSASREVKEYLSKVDETLEDFTKEIHDFGTSNEAHTNAVNELSETIREAQK